MCERRGVASAHSPSTPVPPGSSSLSFSVSFSHSPSFNVCLPPRLDLFSPWLRPFPLPSLSHSYSLWLAVLLFPISPSGLSLLGISRVPRPIPHSSIPPSRPRPDQRLAPPPQGAPLLSDPSAASCSVSDWEGKSPKRPWPQRGHGTASARPLIPPSSGADAADGDDTNH